MGAFRVLNTHFYPLDIFIHFLSSFTSTKCHDQVLCREAGHRSGGDSAHPKREFGCPCEGRDTDPSDLEMGDTRVWFALSPIVGINWIQGELYMSSVVSDSLRPHGL